MSEIDQRAVLQRLIDERGTDYSGLSRLLGRNPAYIQQFIKRGTPKQLTEIDRITLARFFGVAGSVLGGAPAEPQLVSGLVAIPRYDIDASAGPGAFDGTERPVTHIGFEAEWLKALCQSPVYDLSIIRVQGDSMYPTLADGDDIMVDRSDTTRRIRDGIYVLRRDDMLVVKRLAPGPTGKLLTIKSDNPAYPAWTDCALDSIVIVGRVVWAGRKIT